MKGVFIILYYFFIFFFNINESFSYRQISFSDGFWYLVKDSETSDCYIFAEKLDSYGNFKNPRKANVIFRKIKNNIECSINSGTVLKAQDELSLIVRKNGKIFTFIPNERFASYAFLSKKLEGIELVKEILKDGNFIHIFLQSAFNEYAVDVYSLNGFKKVFDKMNKIC